MSSDSRPLKILFAGNYEPDYNRTVIIRKGLKKLGHVIVDCAFKKCNSEAKMRLSQAVQDVDFIFMPSFTHREVRFVKRHSKGKKIIFDPLISRYMTKVHDYKLVFKYSLSALRNYLRDLFSLRAADFVVTDTGQHLEYFHKQFNVPKEKMEVLYIGNDFDEFFPKDKPTTDKFIVGFYGGFIPLQGVLKILEAAKALKNEPDIQFQIIGSGFQFEDAKEFVKKNELKNVNMPGWVNVRELPAYINGFDVALGIFGGTEKSGVVIPNKIYHYAACARPIITQDSLAIREIFQEGRDIVLIEPTSEKIAQAILDLKNKSHLREQLGQSIYRNLKENYNEIKVAQKLVSIFNQSLR